MKKEMLITLKWKIERDGLKGVFREGVSKFICKVENKLEAFNKAVEFAENVPSWDFERNNIDIHEYIDDCKVCYTTHLIEVLSIENYKE